MMPKRNYSGFIECFLYNSCHLYPFLTDIQNNSYSHFLFTVYCASVNKEMISFQIVVAVGTQMACIKHGQFDYFQEISSSH